MAKKGKRRCDTLPILHPDVAGIDVGASELFAAVSADREPHPVRRFPTFTRDLHALADWLGGDEVYQRLLDSRLPDTGSARPRSLSRQRAARKKVPGRKAANIWIGSLSWTGGHRLGLLTLVLLC